MSFRSLLLGGAAAFSLALSAHGQEAVFPLTVEHALGEITIPAEPQRIISLSDRDSDTLLALGVQPIAVRSPYGFAAGVGPWAEDLLTGDPVIWAGGGWAVDNYEALLALEPDLIVYTQTGGDPDEYRRLSEIAPTLYLPMGAEAWQVTTEQTTLSVAEALGRREDGERLLADLDAYFAEQSEAHPEFTGRTANYLDMSPGRGIWSASSDAAVNRTLYALGFSPLPILLDAPEGVSSIPVSEELLRDYDADIVVGYLFGASFEDLIASAPTVAHLDSVRDGRFIVLEDLSFSTASVVSIRHAIGTLVPQFAEALAE